MPAELTKLKIEAYKKIKCDEQDKVREFVLMFNPTTYTKKYEISYETDQGAGTSGDTQRFGSIKPQDYTFEFIIDGTGASADPVDVSDTIDAFLTTTAKMDGDIHRPLYLRLSWGKLIVTCVLKNADVNYTLFQPDGKPLRAKINATFTENIPDPARVAEENKKSPDLTHQRMIDEGDNLTLMSYRIYEDAAYYIQVAAANNLDNFRKLETGSYVKFPPVGDNKS